MTLTAPPQSDRQHGIEWAHPGLHLRFEYGEGHPVRLVHWATGRSGRQDLRGTVTR